MTWAMLLKYLTFKNALALAAVLGIWLAPGGTRSAGRDLSPIPVYITGGQIMVIRR